MQELHHFKTNLSHTFVDHPRYNESIGGSTLRHRHSRASRIHTDEFRSPNQEFTEYLLYFLLRKIALVFYMIYTIIDTILHTLSTSLRQVHPKEGKSSFRSRTETEDTVLSSSPNLMEPSNSWYKGEFRGEVECDEWGHFAFIE